MLVIEENVAKRVKELDEFHNSSSSDRQVAAMNSIVDEQKVNVYTSALDEISEVAMTINPQLSVLLKHVTRGW